MPLCKERCSDSSSSCLVFRSWPPKCYMSSFAIRSGDGTIDSNPTPFFALSFILRLLDLRPTVNACVGEFSLILFVRLNLGASGLKKCYEWFDGRLLESTVAWLIGGKFCILYSSQGCKSSSFSSRTVLTE